MHRVGRLHLTVRTVKMYPFEKQLLVLRSVVREFF